MSSTSQIAFGCGTFFTFSTTLFLSSRYLNSCAESMHDCRLLQSAIAKSCLVPYIHLIHNTFYNRPLINSLRNNSSLSNFIAGATYMSSDMFIQTIIFLGIRTILSAFTNLDQDSLIYCSNAIQLIIAVPMMKSNIISSFLQSEQQAQEVQL